MIEICVKLQASHGLGHFPRMASLSVKCLECTGSVPQLWIAWLTNWAVMCVLVRTRYAVVLVCVRM